MASSFSSWPQSSTTQPTQLSSKDRKKKPRHRHSPAQLAALNELFEYSDHPTLDERTTLGERLGMETKTVNAWFQNKRASTKKRTRSSVAHDLLPISSILGSASSSSTNTPHQTELDDFGDDDYSPVDRRSRATSLAASLGDPQHQTSFYAGNPEHRHFFAESETMPRRMRMRPTAHQTDELRNLYNINPHPTKEAREDLGERIGMRYQSITNWFQNQRSLAKKRKEDEMDTNKTYMVEFPPESRTFSAFPPPLGLPPLQLLPPGRALASRARRSPSVSLPSSVPFPSAPQPLSQRRRNAVDSISGPRRSRPETYQLHALKDLFTRTSNPSIEERSTLASEIGMDVGKVTNWFRNLRQTARKRAKKHGGEDDEDDGDGGTISSSVSRSGTPFSHSSSSSSGNEADDLMDLDGDEYDGPHKNTHSDNGSEDEHEEAVTPSPESSPLSPAFTAGLHHQLYAGLGLGPIDPAGYAELEKVTAAKFSGIKVEDALLLLSFHQHAVH